MAKKEKLELDDFDIDDDLNFDDFGDSNDLFSEESSDKKSRNPVVSTVKDLGKGAIKGAADKLTDPGFLHRTIKEVLPPTYGEITSAVGSVVGGASELYDDAVREIKPQLSRVAKKIDKLVPAESKILKSFSEKFSKLVGNETEFVSQSAEERDTQAITSSLAGIFEVQNENEQENRARDNAKDSIRNHLEDKRFTSNFGILSSINNSVLRLSNYNDKINQAYQKKSLELQFRSYFVQTRLLESSSKYFQIFEKQNESITKNTALPEFAKIRMDERFKDQAKNKLINSFQSSVFGKDSVIGKGMERIKKSAGEYIRGIKSGLEAGMMGLEAMEQMQEANSQASEFGAGITKSEMVGDLAGRGIVEYGKQKLLPIIKPHIDKNKPLLDTLSRGANKAANIPGAIDSFMKSDEMIDAQNADGPKGFFARGLGNLLGFFKDDGVDKKLTSGFNLRNLNEPAIFDNKVHRSIVDIIPGYLARIHREIVITRTGNDRTPLQMFDFKTGKFNSSRATGDKIMAELKEKANRNGLDYSLDRLVKDQFKDTELNNDQKKKVKHFYSKISTIRNMDYTPENIKKTEVYARLDDETKKLIDDTLKENITDSDDKDTNQLKLTKGLRDAKFKIGDLRGEFELYIEAGLGPVLEEQGLATMKEDGSYEMNEEKYMEFMRENGIATSDKNAKQSIKPTETKDVLEKMSRRKNRPLKGKRSRLAKSDVNTKQGISPLNPKDALEAIKKTKIYQWLYKSGQGDDKEHTGPMAQDVKQNMGEEAAPGGTTIDLVTANGNNMAAIQALQEEQKKQIGSKDSKTVLGTIKNDTAEIVKLLKERTSSSGTAGIKSKIAKIPGTLLNASKDVFNFGKDKIVNPAANFLRNRWDNNKEGLGKGIKSVLSGIESLTSKNKSSGNSDPDKTDVNKLTALDLQKIKAIQLGAKIKGKAGDVFRELLKKFPHYKTIDTSDKAIKEKEKNPPTDTFGAPGTVADRSILGYIGKIAGNVTGRIWEVGKDLVTNKLPSMASGLKRVVKTITGFAANIINAPQDIFLKDKKEPSLRASLMELGQYRDGETGETISTIDDLKKLKGDIVDAKGNIVLAVKDMKDGLYDKNGKPIRSTISKISGALIAGLQKGFKRARVHSKLLFRKGKQLIGKASNYLKGKFGKDSEEGSGINFGGLADIFGSTNDTNEKIYDVLVEIRGIMRGEKTPRHEEKASFKADFVGPMQPGKKGKLATKAQGLKDKAASKLNALKDKGKKFLEGNEKVSNIKGKAEGLWNKAKGLWNQNKPGSDFVGPMPSNSISGKVGQAKDKAEGLWNKAKGFWNQNKPGSDFVGPLPQGSLSGKISQAKDKAKSLLDKAKGKIPEDAFKKLKAAGLAKHKYFQDYMKHGKEFVGPMPDSLSSKLKKKGLDKIDFIQGLISHKQNFVGPQPESKISKLKKILIPERAKNKEMLEANTDPQYRGGNVIDTIMDKGKQALDFVRDKDKVDELKTSAKDKANKVKDGFKDKYQSVKNAKGIRGKGAAIFGSLFGKKEEAPKEEPPKEEPKKEPETKQDPKKKTRRKKKVGVLLGDKPETPKTTTPAFNDKDGSGKRDGAWQDELAKKEAERKERASKGPLEADLNAKYRGKNVIDTMMEKAGSLISMIGGGVSALFGSIGGILGTVGSFLGLKAGAGLLGNIGNVLKAPFKMAGSVIRGGIGLAATVGKPLASGIGAIKNVGSIAKVASIANGVRNVAMVGSLLTGGAASAVLGGLSVAISAVGTMLASPVVLGAIALAATAYVGYKAYKYLTRNSTDKYSTIRIKQYGLTNAGDHVKYNENILKLETYLNDGNIGYDKGKAYILDKKVDVKEMLSIFDIDEKDDKAIGRFNEWFGERFKPFFLTHLTALYAVAPKSTLSDVSSLDPEKRLKYLGMVSFESGPYGISTSPFKDLDELSTDKSLALNDIKNLTTEISDKLKKDGKSEQKKDAAANMPEEKAKPTIKPEIPPVLPVIDKPVNKDKPTSLEVPKGEDGIAPEAAAATKEQDKGNASASPGSVNEATGPIKDGSDAGQFLQIHKGVKLAGAAEPLVDNFKGMVQEYGEQTGKKVDLTSGVRDAAQQKALYDKDPSKAAKPGSSLHELGLALDIDSKDANEMDKLGLMRKYGFTRPVGGEPWHIEPAAFQPKLSLAKTDPDFANEAIKASLGRGGGGLGSIEGSPKGKRDKNLAASLLDASGTKVNPSDKDKTNELLAPKDTTETASKPSSGQTDSKTQVASTDKAKSVPEGPTGSTNIEPVDGGEPKPAPSMAKSVDQSNSYSKNDQLPNTENKPQSTNVADIKSTKGGNVKETITELSKKVGADPGMMTTFAAVESSLNPNARASTSSAAGLYQFTKATWDEQLGKNGAKYDLDKSASPTDVTASTLMASEYIKSNSKLLKSVKSDPNLTDVYLAHFLGAGGARKFLSADPSAIAAKVLSTAAKANRNIFYGKDGKALTIGDVYNNLSAKLSKVAQQYGISLDTGSMKTGASKETEGSSAASSPETAKDTKTTKDTKSASSSPAPISGGTPSTSPDSSTASSPISSNKKPVSLNPNKQTSILSSAPDTNTSMNKGIGADQSGAMNSTLDKSLDIQTQMLEVLKNILENSKASGSKPAESPKEAPKAPQRQTPTNPVKMESTIDLKRKYI